METISEEQVLFNKLSYEEQQFILKQMRMLQPCELSCETEEEKKIPEKLEDYYLDKKGECPIELTIYEQILRDKINEIIDYLESKGE